MFYFIQQTPARGQYLNVRVSAFAHITPSWCMSAKLQIKRAPTF